MGKSCRIQETEAAARAACRRPANIAVVLAVLALAGCAGAGETGSPANVTGNQQGGKVPYAEGGVQSAMEAAKTHCSQFGKKAQIVQMTPAPEGGGTVGFQCR